MRHTKLSGLDPLVGEWVMESSAGGQIVSRARATFGWAEDGAFLVQHVRGEPLGPGEPPGPAEPQNNPLPLVTIFGRDDNSGAFTMLYADARGVFRVYSVLIRGAEWEMWGQAGPDFHQRFIATFSDDGKVITGAWQRSSDGFDYEVDFDVTYFKIAV
jgi:hypothetical protein